METIWKYHVMGSFARKTKRWKSKLSHSCVSLWQNEISFKQITNVINFFLEINTLENNLDTMELNYFECDDDEEETYRWGNLCTGSSKNKTFLHVSCFY